MKGEYMATVGFLRGLSSALPSSSPSDGTFYVTTDTYELYYSDGSSLHRINAAASPTADSGWVTIGSATSISMTSEYYILALPDAAKAFNTLHIQVQIKPSEQSKITIMAHMRIYPTASGNIDVPVATSAYTTRSYLANELCLCDIYLTRESSMCTKDIYVDGALVNHEVIPTLGASPTYDTLPSFPRDSSAVRWERITFKASTPSLSGTTDNYYIITGKGRY